MYCDEEISIMCFAFIMCKGERDNPDLKSNGLYRMPEAFVLESVIDKVS